MPLASPLPSSSVALGPDDAAAIPGRDEGPLVPLVVDLDGTLLRTDLLLEGVVAILRRNVLMIFAMLAWLPRGRAYFKRRVAEHAALDFATLPVNEDLLAYIELQKTLGREIVLATAADELMARGIVERFPLFDRAVSSDGLVNLKGEVKAKALAALFPRGFDYAGNAAVDLPIWARAQRVILVETPASVARAGGGARSRKSPPPRACAPSPRACGCTNGPRTASSSCR